MSTSSTATEAQNTASCSKSTSSLRKRHSPNTNGGGSSCRDPGSGATSPASAASSVNIATASKQRRIECNTGKVLIEDSVDTSGGRELRYLTDFFPDQPPETGRLTRSKSRVGPREVGSGPASPACNSEQISPSALLTNNEEDDTVASHESSSRPKSGPSRAGGRRAKSATASASGSPNPSRAEEPPHVPPIHSTTGACTSQSRADPRVFPGGTWEILGEGAVSYEQPGSSNEQAPSFAHPHIMAPFLHTHAHPLMNQIPVIQPPPNSGVVPGVPLSLSGMLFDPLSQSPATAHGRAISRSAASQFIHGLVPRMQHLLGGHKAVQHDSRVTGIMEGLRSANELRQAEAASELAEWLLMANEDNLPTHLPIRDITQALIQLLQKEHNFELMLTAARCLTNLLEAVPRSQPIVVEAVPYLLEKLKRIECIDVAEQSLTALEELSKRNSKTILSSGGIAACISHVDFFSLASQRLAFAIASNCAMYLSSSDFAMVRDSLSDLTDRLLIEDKRCLESVCQLFARLVENLKNHPDKLREIAGSNYRLLALMQQLLIAQPSQLNSNTFSSIVRMLRTLSGKCPDLAAALIRMDYQTTLRTLFTGSTEPDAIEIVERPPNQLQDMVYLVGELFPRLPTSGIFEIDSAYTKQSSVLPECHWYWQDDTGTWQPFRSHESRLIEQNKNSGHLVLELQIGPRMYRLDVEHMTQKNVATGKERSIQRRTYSPNKVAKTNSDEDGRLTILQSDPDVMERVVGALFPVLVAIDGSSSGPALRFECLRVMLRMVCPTSPSVLRSVLSNLPLSGHIASALASPRSKDLIIVVAALQMVHLLLEKMSDVYSPLFRKEGVAHEVMKLAATNVETKSAPASGTASPLLNQTDMPPRVTRSHRNRTSTGAVSNSSSGGLLDESRCLRGGNKKNEVTSHRDNQMVNQGMSNRHRKRSSPEGSCPVVKKEKESRRKSSSFLQSLRIPGLKPSPNTAPATSNSPLPPATPPSASIINPGNSFLAQMVSMSPSSSGSSSSSRTCTSYPLGTSQGSLLVPSTATPPSHLSSPAKEKVKLWIKKEAELLLKTYLGNTGSGGSVIDCLSWVAEQLNRRDADAGTTPLSQLHDILHKDSVSAFEMTHSGVISALHIYLVSEDPSLQPPRKLRLRRFAAIFMHLTADNLRPSGDDGCFAVFEALVSKVLASVAQLEQFQVKVNDMGGIVTGTNGCLRGAAALKFFQSHQMKCYLRRHPVCRDLRDYHKHGGSTIKVDPFTSISAIEKYLLDKGVGRPRNGEESSGDDISDDEDALVGGSQTGETKRIEMVLGDRALPSQMSILQAIRQYSPAVTEDHTGSIGNSLWMATHTLYYRSASGPSPPPQPLVPIPLINKEKKHRINEKVWQEGEVDTHLSPLWVYLHSSLPCGVDDPCVSSLLLIRALYGLNRHWHALFDDEPSLPTTYAPLLSGSSFNSSKLAAKLSRQLSDFISVATQDIPEWTVNIVKAVPFLFPFPLRRSLLYCTSFGRDRALMHLVNQTEGVQGEGESGRLTLGRLERRKIVIKRDDLIKTAESALATNASSRAMLEVSFEGEAGTGFGPTLEFYSTVSKELQNATLKLWHGPAQRDNSEDDECSAEYVIPGSGLYPIAVPQSQRKDNARVKKFEMVGRLMGQALVDCRMLDLPLSPVFLHWLAADPSQLGIADVETLDAQLYQSLRQLSLTSDEDFQHLEQYFTLPGNESFELMKGGRNRIVAKDNVRQYIKLVAWWRLAEGVWREMDAVRRGFAQVVDPMHLSLFLPEELDQLFCGCSDGGERVWGESSLAQAIKPDHGYTHDSDQIKWLTSMLASFDRDEQRKFVQFVTGSPRLPVGGFRALNPPLTVVRKTAAYGSGDDELPSAMTCYNYLKVPAYSSYEVFRERFKVALRFIYSFHLT